jgi:hypothetical protein
MRKPNPSRPRISPDHSEHRPATRDRLAARRPSPQLIADAVTASYIHNISQNHRRPRLTDGRRRRPDG